MPKSKDKIAFIGEHLRANYGAASIEDMTVALYEVMYHPRQAKKLEELPVVNALPEKEIVDKLYKHLLVNKEGKIAGHCGHFAYVLTGIGIEEFGHDCTLVKCNANYLDNHHHVVVYDATLAKVLDASLHKAAFVGGRWVKIEESGIERTNITRDMVDNVRLSHTQWESAFK